MKNLLLLVGLLLMCESAWARGMHALKARFAARLVFALQVQQSMGTKALLFVLAKEAGKDMPDYPPERRETTSPDNPNNGKPAWDKKRRSGGSPIYGGGSRSRGGRTARNWDAPAPGDRNYDGF